MTAEIVSLKLYKARKAREDVGPDPIIEWWKCRVGVCMVRVGVTQTGLDTLALFNAELRRRREKPIEKDEVMVCPDHTDKLNRSRW